MFSVLTGSQANPGLLVQGCSGLFGASWVTSLEAILAEGLTDLGLSSPPAASVLEGDTCNKGRHIF